MQGVVGVGAYGRQTWGSRFCAKTRALFSSLDLFHCSALGGGVRLGPTFSN